MLWGAYAEVIARFLPPLRNVMVHVLLLVWCMSLMACAAFGARQKPTPAISHIVPPPFPFPFPFPLPLGSGLETWSEEKMYKDLFFLSVELWSMCVSCRARMSMLFFPTRLIVVSHSVIPSPEQLMVAMLSFCPYGHFPPSVVSCIGAS